MSLSLHGRIYRRRTQAAKFYKRSLGEKRHIFQVMTTKLSFNFRSAMAHRDPKRANSTVAGRAAKSGLLCCFAGRSLIAAAGVKGRKSYAMLIMSTLSPLHTST